MSVNNSKDREPAITNARLIHFRVVFQENFFFFFYDNSGHWHRLLVNLSDLIKYIDSKSRLGEKEPVRISLLKSGLFFWDRYIHVFLSLTFSFASLTSSRRNIKPLYPESAVDATLLSRSSEEFSLPNCKCGLKEK